MAQIVLPKNWIWDDLGIWWKILAYTTPVHPSTIRRLLAVKGHHDLHGLWANPPKSLGHTLVPHYPWYKISVTSRLSQANVHRLPMDLSVHYASHFPEGQGSSAQHKHPSICPISSYRLYKHNFTNQSKSVFESQLSRHVWLQSNSISTLPMILCAFLKIRCPDFAVVGVWFACVILGYVSRCYFTSDSCKLWASWRTKTTYTHVSYIHYCLYISLSLWLNAAMYGLVRQFLYLIWNNYVYLLFSDGITMSNHV